MPGGYLLIESRDVFEGPTPFLELARTLAQEKREGPVTLFLVENGVLPTRRCPSSEALSALAKAGVEVLADEFSLKERGIGRERMIPEVKLAALDVVIEHMVAGKKILWH